MDTRNENSLNKGFQIGEKNLVFQQPPPPGPASAPSATPPAAPEQKKPAEARQDLKEEVDTDRDRNLKEFESEFNTNIIDILKTVDDNGQKYNFDKWALNKSWGTSPQAEEIYKEIQKVCAGFKSQNGVNALIEGLRNESGEMHVKAKLTLERCVKNLRDKEKVVQTSQTQIEELHDVPVAKQLSDWTKNIFSFYHQQDTTGKIALLFSVGWVLKMSMDKELMAKESPFKCTWKTLRNLMLLGLGGNYLVAAARDSHKPLFSLGADKTSENVPEQARSILLEAGVKEPGQIAAMGTLVTFDTPKMQDWFALYGASDSQSINPEGAPFGFYKLTPPAVKQRGKDLWNIMNILVKKAGGPEAFSKKYLENSNKAYDFMSIVYDLNLTGRPSIVTTPETIKRNTELVNSKLFPVLGKEGPNGDFEPRLKEDATVMYLKTVPVQYVPLQDAAQKENYSFNIIVRGEVVNVDPNDANSLKGRLEVLDALLQKDMKTRISTHEAFEGKEPYWASGLWAVKDVTIEGKKYEKLYLRAHNTDPGMFFWVHSGREVLCGTRSIESSERNSTYEESVRSYPGGAFAGLEVLVISSKTEGSKTSLTGEIANVPFKAEYDETNGTIKMLEFDYDKSDFASAKRRRAAETIFTRETFDKLAGLAELAPEKSYLKDSIDEDYWKGLVGFKHYEALNLYEEYLKRARTPEDVAKADERLVKARQEIERLFSNIEKQVNAPDAKISAADFAEWCQKLDNLDYWYGNSSYSGFMLDMRKELMEQDFEGISEEEYKVFMLIYKKVSDKTAMFALIKRDLNEYEKAYLDYVREQVRGLVRKSEQDKESFGLSLKGIKGLLDHVDESIKPKDVAQFLNIEDYRVWAANRPGALSASSDIIGLGPDVLLNPGDKMPTHFEDGRLTERGAYLSMEGRYNAVKKTFDDMNVRENELTDKGKFFTGLSDLIGKRYDDAKRISAVSDKQGQSDALKQYVRDILAVYEKYLPKTRFEELKKKLPGNLEY